MNVLTSRVAAHAARRRLPQRLPHLPRRHSSSNAPAINHNVEESMGAMFWALVAAIPSAVVVYNLAQPGANGEEPVLTSWLRGKIRKRDDSFEINAAHAELVEQAARDRHLFMAQEKSPVFTSRYPELIFSHSQRNVSASSYVNLGDVVEHYRNKYWEEEAAKPKRREWKQKMAENLAAANVGGKKSPSLEPS